MCAAFRLHRDNGDCFFWYRMLGWRANSWEGTQMTFGQICSATIVLAMGISASAQDRPLSPRGMASVQILGKFVKPAGHGAPALGGERYEGGKWIEITYGRPLKRGRDLWGSGVDYGKAALVGTPIWRAGADESTRLNTEVPLIIAGQTLPPGEYSLFIDLKEDHWTFVVSSWAALPKFDRNNKNGLWGSYFYTPDKDVLRAPMTLETQAHSTEELTWEFLDISDAGGTMALRWDKVLAMIPFKVVNPAP
jgi:hypothetical protein